MEVTLQDVLDYWKRYCERHDLRPDILVQGQCDIAMDHHYWADHPMQQLRDRVVQHLKKKPEDERLQNFGSPMA